MRLHLSGLAPGLLAALLVSLLTLQQTQAIKWLALAKSKQRFWNQTRHCIEARENGGLLKFQVKLCRRHLELMGVLVHASREAMTVCQQLFTDRRWNCSSVTRAPQYLNDLTGGSREQAYVYSLASAAMARAVAKACSVGATTKCSCGRTPREAPPSEFKWGGCGDDLHFGLKFTELFADKQFLRKRAKRKRGKRSQVNVHNLAAGRKVLAESLATACKCHGVSGSCSIKTCWKALGDLRQIGAELKQKYHVAVEVPSGNARKLIPVHHEKKDFASDELIYYTKSPDYCNPDEALGSIGTRGRECKKGHPGSSGCRSMCCGRGYTSEVMEMKQRCDCKYYWCCYVKCKTCLEKVEINRCR